MMHSADHREKPGALVPAVAFASISKTFSGQRVLDDVTFDVRAGETHVLAGENGAGKSTLMKILCGVHRPDSGEVLMAGEPAHIDSVHEAARRGIAMIHQELSLAPSMSVRDNLFLGRERAGRFGWIDRAGQTRKARESLQRVGLAHVDPSRIVASLPLAARQLVEIAKALLHDARVLIMDEPTSALPKPDAERLFGLIGELKTNATSHAAIIYISHRMEEIYRLADRITVLRDGRHVVTAPASELPREALVQAMVGRAIGEQHAREGLKMGEELMRVEDLCVRGEAGLTVRDASFTLHRGEVVGIAGLQGSGAGELLHALFGDGRVVSGSIAVNGGGVRWKSPRNAMWGGAALLTDDRKTTGLCQGLSVGSNLALPSARKLSPGGWRSVRDERELVVRAVNAFGVRCRSVSQPVGTLSGGNQQKVALGKWLLREPAILLLHDPTRGVDVGARQEIYHLIDDAAARGAAVLFTSSDLPELLALSDRVIVMHRGTIMARFDRGEASPHMVIAAAMGESDASRGGAAA